MIELSKCPTCAVEDRVTIAGKEFCMRCGTPDHTDNSTSLESSVSTETTKDSTQLDDSQLKNTVARFNEPTSQSTPEANIEQPPAPGSIPDNNTQSQAQNYNPSAPSQQSPPQFYGAGVVPNDGSVTPQPTGPVMQNPQNDMPPTQAGAPQHIQQNSFSADNTPVPGQPAINPQAISPQHMEASIQQNSAPGVVPQPGVPLTANYYPAQPQNNTAHIDVNSAVAVNGTTSSENLAPDPQNIDPSILYSTPTSAPPVTPSNQATGDVATPGDSSSPYPRQAIGSTDTEQSNTGLQNSAVVANMTPSVPEIDRVNTSQPLTSSEGAGSHQISGQQQFNINANTPVQPIDLRNHDDSGVFSDAQLEALSKSIGGPDELKRPDGHPDNNIQSQYQPTVEGVVSAPKPLGSVANELKSATPPSVKNKVKGPKKDTKSKKALKPAGVALSVVALFLVGAYIWQVNYSTLAFKIASTKAGMNATMPGYVPGGYKLVGEIQTNPGTVAYSLLNGGQDKKIAISQTKTDWDSQALAENYVAPKAENYLALQAQGLTIYMLGESQATWINKGVWYKIESPDQSLSQDQAIKMATSL